MLDIERRVATALLHWPQEGTATRVEHFVDTSLRAMPEHLRAGVAAESLLVAGMTRIVQVVSRRNATEALGTTLNLLARSPISVLREYPRLFRSLVLFAECEIRSARVRP
ncbi:MAG: hypothetical protein ACR2H3_14015 [Acidimicrobiales bacterium]